MPDLVDIHTHLLPGIDDGPQTLEESLEMARAAVSAGISTIAATPHLRSDFPGVHVHEIAERCEILRGQLEAEQIPLSVISGAEVSLVWALEASDEELRLASYGQRGTDLLVETPSDVSMLDRLLFNVRSKGFRIILAHPERSPAYQRDPGMLERVREQGVLLQVNAEGLCRGRRSPPARLAAALCRDGLAHAVASDGHRGEAWRPVIALAGALRELKQEVGHERAGWLVSAAPEAILSGAALPPQPAASEPPPRRRWLRSR